MICFLNVYHTFVQIAKQLIDVNRVIKVRYGSFVIYHELDVVKFVRFYLIVVLFIFGNK